MFTVQDTTLGTFAVEENALTILEVSLQTAQSSGGCEAHDRLAKSWQSG